jgi:hypothetical protein
MTILTSIIVLVVDLLCGREGKKLRKIASGNK